MYTYTDYHRWLPKKVSIGERRLAAGGLSPTTTSPSLSNCDLVGRMFHSWKFDLVDRYEFLGALFVFRVPYHSLRI